MHNAILREETPYCICISLPRYKNMSVRSSATKDLWTFWIPLL